MLRKHLETFHSDFAVGNQSSTSRMKPTGSVTEISSS
jgi:hypothetical protein